MATFFSRLMAMTAMSVAFCAATSTPAHADAPSRVNGLMTMERQHGLHMMRQLWPIAAPHFGRRPNSVMPRVHFIDDTVSAPKTVWRKGNKAGTRRMYWPDETNLAFISALEATAETDLTRSQVFEALLVQWTRYFQVDGLNGWQSRGGAQLLTRRIAKPVFAKARLYYSPFMYRYQPYQQEMHKAKALGEDWIRRGQLQPSNLWP